MTRVKVKVTRMKVKGDEDKGKVVMMRAEMLMM